MFVVRLLQEQKLVVALPLNCLGAAAAAAVWRLNGRVVSVSPVNGGAGCV